MKGKRLVASMLALLLVVSLLPMAAMAEETTFSENNGIIAEGQEVTYNHAANVTNYGTVTNNTWGSEESPLPVSIKENYGTVVNNGGNADDHKGTVENNHAGATVVNNKPTGIVKNNDGLVGKKDENGNLITNGPSGNSGKVENNQQGGVVVNNSGGIVLNNYSTGDGTNPGVINNGGTVSVNNGTVDNFAGQVYSNTTGGKILNNYGTVGARPEPEDTAVPSPSNLGTVETNHMSGWVTNNVTGDNGYGEGRVNTNYGTVCQIEKSGTLTYYYGLHGEDENKETDTKYTEEGYSLGHTAGAEVNLDDTAASYQREGYKLSSYTVWTYDEASTADDKLVQQTVADRTKYTINAPTLLKLFWEKIVTAVAPSASSGGGAEAVPTSYTP